jgi:thiol-disulfide isomerase/thioredoxin
MNKPGIFFLLLFAFGLLLGCKKTDQTKIVIYTSAPLDSLLTIKDIPFHNEKRVTVDSAIIRNNKDSLVLYVPGKLQKLYTINLKGQRLRIIFINDAPLIRVHVNYFSNKYTITGSKATVSLSKLEDEQLVRSKKTRSTNRALDSLKALHINGKPLDSLKGLLNKQLNAFYKQYEIYADTVTSPAAFMKVYNLVDFGDDHQAAKKFIIRNAARFSGYKPMQDLKKEVLATIRIYEEEFNIGDKLPAITLPDKDGKPFSTASLNNQYYLIDFWSTLCAQCMPFKVAEKQVAAKIAPGKLQIISVAIDDQQEEWGKNISINKFSWPQLIDVKMWQGPAVRTLVFDSIPFNFLVAPGGRIIKKAIKPDSLMQTVLKLKLDK